MSEQQVKVHVPLPFSRTPPWRIRAARLEDLPVAHAEGYAARAACGTTDARQHHPVRVNNISLVKPHNEKRETHELVEQPTHDRLYRRARNLVQAHTAHLAARRGGLRGVSARGGPPDDRVEVPSGRDVLAEDVRVEHARGRALVVVPRREVRGERVKEHEEVRVQNATA